MSIRWSAIAIGFAADFLLSVMLGGFFNADDIAYATLGSPVAPALLLVNALVLLASGYVAGRVARQDGPMHGVVLGALDVLLSVALGLLPGGLMTKLLAISSLVGWLAAALGGYLSRFPARAE